MRNHLIRQAARRGTAPGMEILEDRVVPAAAGPEQLQAAQLSSAIAITVEAAFEANYKGQSLNQTVFQLANLISAFLHSEQNSLAANLSLQLQPSQSTVNVLQQMQNYVTAEVNAFESWYFTATKANTPTTILLGQMTAFATSFQNVEQSSSRAINQELASGTFQATNATAFTYTVPAFINPSGGGVSVPSGTPSIIAPSAIISTMNNDQIGQLTAVVSGSQSASVISVALSTNPSVVGQAATAVATVKAAGGSSAAPASTVTFSIDGTAQTPVPVSNGQASLSLAGLAAGNHTITASYSGDTNFLAATTTSPVTQTVGPAATTTTLASSAATGSVFGQPVTFTATVVPTAPGGGTANSGTVTFTIDGTAQTPVNVINGQATLALSNLTVATHTVTATYNGSTSFSASAASAAFAQAVGKSSTTTALTATQFSSNTANPLINLLATITPAATGGVAPSGNVIFSIDTANQPAVAVANGTAALQTAGLTPGSHTFSAVYQGDTNYIGSTGGPTTVSIDKQSAQVGLVSSANPTPAATPPTITATVTPVAPPGAGVPGGTVTFSIDNGAPSAPVKLDATGQATFPLPTGLAAGNHIITATYSGDTNYAPASANFSQNLT